MFTKKLFAAMLFAVLVTPLAAQYSPKITYEHGSPVEIDWGGNPTSVLFNLYSGKDTTIVVYSWYQSIAGLRPRVIGLRFSDLTDLTNLRLVARVADSNGVGEATSFGYENLFPKGWEWRKRGFNLDPSRGFNFAKSLTLGWDAEMISAKVDFDVTRRRLFPEEHIVLSFNENGFNGGVDLKYENRYFDLNAGIRRYFDRPFFGTIAHLPYGFYVGASTGENRYDLQIPELFWGGKMPPSVDRKDDVISWRSNLWMVGISPESRRYGRLNIEITGINSKIEEKDGWFWDDEWEGWITATYNRQALHFRTQWQGHFKGFFPGIELDVPVIEQLEESGHRFQQFDDEFRFWRERYFIGYIPPVFSGTLLCTTEFSRMNTGDNRIQFSICKGFK